MIDIKKVEEIIKRAAEIQLSFFDKVGMGSGVTGDKISIEVKEQDSIVTEADLVTEKFLIDELSKLLPGASFIGEESGATENADFCWVIDPLDGTTNFSRGIPYFCISVALTFKCDPIYAFIYDPLRQEMFFAKKDGGAYLNGVTIRVVERDENLIVAISFPYGGKMAAEIIQVIENLKRDLCGIRIPGAMALDLAYVACGRFDGVFSGRLGWWDIAAGILIIKEAGGRCSDSKGASLGPDYEDCVAGSIKGFNRILSIF
jgi:myo-inositol-1(or 4)-monophosphatase